MALSVVFLGPTGSGKSRQAKLLAEKRGWAYISTGELMRTKSEGVHRERMNAGELAESDYINGLLDQEIRRLQPLAGLVLDGYPRMVSEQQWFDQQLSTYDLELHRVFEIIVSREESYKRLDYRSRDDDTRESIERKWRWYEGETQQVLQGYQAQGKLAKIDGVGTWDEVAERIEAAW